MGTPVVMTPHTIWAERGRQQATRNQQACIQAAQDIESMVYADLWPVTLIEHDYMIDVGTVRLEPSRLVFTGERETRCVPFATVVLMGTQPVITAPGRNACSVNSSEYPTRMLFLGDYPIEYHVAAWYSRWLEMTPFTEFDPPGMLPSITPT